MQPACRLKIRNYCPTRGQIPVSKPSDGLRLRFWDWPGDAVGLQFMNTAAELGPPCGSRLARTSRTAQKNRQRASFQSPVSPLLINHTRFQLLAADVDAVRAAIFCTQTLRSGESEVNRMRVCRDAPVTGPTTLA